MQIKANGIFLEYKDHGKPDDTPLVLIRGLGTQLVHWPDELIAGFVSAGYRVITFDNRGVGLSQRIDHLGVATDAATILKRFQQGKPQPAVFDITDMARDVVGLMDSLNIPKAHCFGISMGGIITQILALAHSDRLLSATHVMSICRPLFAGPKGEKRLSMCLALPGTLAQFQDGHVGSFKTYGSPGYPMSETELRAQAKLAYDRNSDTDGINSHALALLQSPDRRAALHKITLPCLVIHGVEDTLIPIDVGAEVAANIPNSEYHAIEGMGHIITPLLAPLIVKIVAEFLGRRALT